MATPKEANLCAEIGHTVTDESTERCNGCGATLAEYCGYCGELVWADYVERCLCDDDDEYDDDYYAEEDDEMEYWLSECGQQRDGTCLNAGTEHCDFDCPFRDDPLDWLGEEEE